MITHCVVKKITTSHLALIRLKNKIKSNVFYQVYFKYNKYL